MDHDPKTGLLRDIGDDWALLGVGDGTPQHNEYEKEKGGLHEFCRGSRDQYHFFPFNPDCPCMD